MKRFQRVNLYNSSNWDEIEKNSEYKFQDIKSSIERSGGSQDCSFQVHWDISYIQAAIYSFFFEIPSSSIPLAYFIDSGIELSKGFFFGKWRERHICDGDSKPLTKEQARLLPWNGAFREGTFCCLLKNDKTSLVDFSKWVGRDQLNCLSSNPFDISNPHTYVPHFSPLFFVVAQFWCGCSIDDYSDEIEMVKKSKSASAKSLLKIWESVCEKDTDGFEKKIIQEVERKMNKAAKTKDPRIAFAPVTIVSAEATWMWNLALRSGMEMPILSEEIMDRIITPQALGLEK